MIRRLALAVAISAGVAACSTPEQKCSDLGLEPRTPDFAYCVMGIRMDEAAQAQRALIIGQSMQSLGQSMQMSQPATVIMPPQRLQAFCTTYGQTIVCN